MLLRSSITSTKKFFQKTVKNFKSLFSTGYQRLPKSPSHTPCSVSAMNAMDMNSNTSYHDMEKLYSDFSDQWEEEKEKEWRRINKKAAALPSPTQQENKVYNGSKKMQVGKTEEFAKKNNKRSLTLQSTKQKDSSFNSMGMKEHRYFMVRQKLRELEMLDMSNEDHLMDIEEVLHYYSLLTCPVYLDIVDRFFLEMYSELSGPVLWPDTPRSVNSRLKLRYQ